MTASSSKKSPKCPFCHAEILEPSQFAPFCSKRCKVNDLGAWASEKYRIASEPVDLNDALTSDGENSDDEEGEASSHHYKANEKLH